MSDFRYLLPKNKLLNQARFIRPEGAWFGIMCALPRLLVTSGEIWTLYNWLNNLCYFYFQYMALAVDAIGEYDPSNKIYHQLQLEKYCCLQALLLNKCAKL